MALQAQLSPKQVSTEEDADRSKKPAPYALNVLPEVLFSVTIVYCPVKVPAVDGRLW